MNGGSSTLLLVGGADRGALLIVKQGHVDGAGPVPFCKFAGAAYIQQWSLQLSQLQDII